jgi:hypothetical protein
LFKKNKNNIIKVKKLIKKIIKNKNNIKIINNIQTKIKNPNM